jgi:uncharacterized membrane protein YhaH (DUF805 family)
VRDYLILWGVIGAFFVVLTIVANGGLGAMAEDWKRRTADLPPRKRSGLSDDLWIIVIGFLIYLVLRVFLP